MPSTGGSRGDIAGFLNGLLNHHHSTPKTDNFRPTRWTRPRDTSSFLTPWSHHWPLRAHYVTVSTISTSTTQGIDPITISSGRTPSTTYHRPSNTTRTLSSPSDSMTPSVVTCRPIATDLDDPHNVVDDVYNYDPNSGELFDLLASLLEIPGMENERRVDMDGAREIQIALTSIQRSSSTQMSKRDTEVQGPWRQLNGGESAVTTCVVRMPAIIVKQVSPSHTTIRLKPVASVKPEPVCETHIPIQHIEVINKPVEGLQQVEGVNQLVTPVTTLTSERTLYAGVDGMAMTPAKPAITQTYIIDNRAKSTSTSGTSSWMLPSVRKIVSIAGAVFLILTYHSG